MLVRRAVRLGCTAYRRDMYSIIHVHRTPGISAYPSNHPYDVALPYTVPSSPLATSANSCRASRIFRVVLELPNQRLPRLISHYIMKTYRRIAAFSFVFASTVVFALGNPSSARIPFNHSPISIPFTLVTKVASNSAKFGITDRGPSEPADRRIARSSWGPKCFNRVSTAGSRGEG